MACSPLPDALYAQERSSADPLTMAAAYVDPEKGVETAQDALQGAEDILAEQISDEPPCASACGLSAWQSAA